MQTVLFVDDNKYILENYKRLFRDHNENWRVLFACDAAEATEILENHYIDVIISDLEMPVINGTALLGYVKKHSPLTMRIIFTGCIEEKNVMETVKLAHQIYLKPNSRNEVIEILNRALYLHKIRMNPNVRRILMNIGSVPSVPEIVQEIVIAAEDENYSLKELGALISQDIGMSVNVLRLINSPYFGLRNQIVSIEQAVSLLGLEILKTLIISVHLFESFPNLSVEKMDELMEHSCNCANFCRAIFTAEKRSKDECDEAFITGFMHDIGRIILLSSFPDIYLEIIKSTEFNKTNFSTEEKRLLGVSHEEISAFILALWGFTDTIIEAVAFHHAPSLAKCKDPLLLAVIHSADLYEYEISKSKVNRQQGLDVTFLDKWHLTNKEEKWLSICENEIP